MLIILHKSLYKTYMTRGNTAVNYAFTCAQWCVLLMTLLCTALCVWYWFNTGLRLVLFTDTGQILNDISSYYTVESSNDINQDK